MSSIPVTDDNHWRALRLKHVGASDVAALFGLSPWLTRWQLYHIKRGALPENFETGVMTQGKFFEPAIAAYAQDKFNIQLRKVRRYLSSDTVPGLGASLDYEEFGGGSLVPTEIKWSLYGDGWDWEGDELTNIPDAYMMQCQHQLAACPSAPHAQLIAFTGGDLKRMIIPRSERLIAAIESAVTEFWADVAGNIEPPVDFSVDAGAISRLAYVSKLRTLTMTPDQSKLFEAWDRARADAADAETRLDAAKAEVLKAVVDAGEGPDTAVKVVCGDWRVSISKVPESLGKEVTSDMVGSRIGARKGHLRCALKREGG